MSAKNGQNGEMPFQYEKLYESQDGNSLVLTIDEVVQHFVEKHLEIAVNEHEVKERATAIVMDVDTGEILAMASKPDFDPNNPRQLTDKQAVIRLEKEIAKKRTSSTVQANTQTDENAQAANSGEVINQGTQGENTEQVQQTVQQGTTATTEQKELTVADVTDEDLLLSLIHI